MSPLPPRAPSPARFAQGDAVLAGGSPAEVSVVYPADRSGRRLYCVEWPTPRDGFAEVGILEEGELAPVGRA